MSEPILVRPDNPVDIKREDLTDLIERLRDEGLDARIARVEEEGFGVDPWWTDVAIWVAAGAGGAVGRALIDPIIALAVGWARERLRRPLEEGHPLRRRPRSSQQQKGVRVTIVRYQGNEGQAVEIVELDEEDADPVRRPPEGFERNTRFRPPESVGSVPAVREDIRQQLPTLPLPPLPGNEEDLLRENRERLYNRAGRYPIDAVLDAWLHIEAEAHAAAIRNNIDLSQGTTHILRTLVDHGRIPEFVFDATLTLRQLRSDVAPRPLPGLSTAEANVYIDTVARVIAYLARA